MKSPGNGWTWSTVGFAEWSSNVDQRLQEIYCITIEDAGIDEELLKNHWKAEEPPFEFVSWFGNKYDLDVVAVSSPYQIALSLRQLRTDG